MDSWDVYCAICGSCFGGSRFTRRSRSRPQDDSAPAMAPMRRKATKKRKTTMTTTMTMMPNIAMIPTSFQKRRLGGRSVFALLASIQTLPALRSAFPISHDRHLVPVRDLRVTFSRRAKMCSKIKPHMCKWLGQGTSQFLSCANSPLMPWTPSQRGHTALVNGGESRYEHILSSLEPF